MLVGFFAYQDLWFGKRKSGNASETNRRLRFSICPFTRGTTKSAAADFDWVFV